MVKNFLQSEKGTTIEYLARITIIGLGSATILFGILVALRQKGAEIINAISSVNF